MENVFRYSLGIALFAATDAQVEYCRAVIQCGYRALVPERGNSNEELEFAEVDILEMVEYFHVFRRGTFQVTGAFVPRVKEQSRGTGVDECRDDVVHRCGRFGFPSLFFAKGVESPQARVVALCRDDSFGTQDVGYPAGESVGSPDVSRQDGNDVSPRGVDVDDCRVGVFRLHGRGYGTDAYTESPDEDEGIVPGKMFGHESGDGRDTGTIRLFSFGEKFSTGQFLPYGAGDL